MGSVKDDERFGAWINKYATYQQGNIMVPLFRWPLGQWALGLIDPLENLRGMNGDESSNNKRQA
jgi:hypothetical protein